MQAGDPTFRPAIQRGYVLIINRQPHRFTEITGRFRRGKAQISGAQLQDIAARAQFRQRQRGIMARRQHQMQRAWRMTQQIGQQLVNGTVVDHMVIVQNHDKFPINGGQFIAQICG